MNGLPESSGGDTENRRKGYILVGLVLAVAMIVGLAQQWAADAGALTLATFALGFALCLGMAELSRRGHPRLGFTLLVIGMITTSLPTLAPPR